MLITTWLWDLCHTGAQYLMNTKNYWSSWSRSKVTEVKLLLPGGSTYSGYGMQQQTQPPVQPAAGTGGYSSYGGQSQGYEQNSNYQSGSYGQPPASTYGGQQANTYGSQPSTNYSALPPQGNYGGPPPPPPPPQGSYGGPPSGSYGGPQGPNYGAPPPPSNGNYGGQGGGYNSKLCFFCLSLSIFSGIGTD